MDEGENCRHFLAVNPGSVLFIESTVDLPMSLTPNRTVLFPWRDRSRDWRPLEYFTERSMRRREYASSDKIMCL